MMHNGGLLVLNPLTKAANAGSLAMQMHFEPLENKNTSHALIGGNSKPKFLDGVTGSNSSDFRNQVR
jgi:hypothetical protein